MIILGIDPGANRIGFGVVENINNHFSCRDYGIIEGKEENRFLNFKIVADKILALIKKHGPDIVSIEKLFFYTNQKTVMAVSEMRGVILHTIASCNIPIIELTPLQIKQGVSYYGRAGKGQVQKMVRLILDIKEPISPDDAADALAIAICGINNYTPSCS